MTATNVQNAASVATLFILLAILLVLFRAWCRGVTRKVAVGNNPTRAGLTGRILRAMSWRVGLVVSGIITLALASSHGPNDVVAQSLVSAAILSYPLILLSLWQIARRISKKIFQTVSPDQRPEITTAVREAAIKASRFSPTVMEGIVAVWFAMMLVSYFVIALACVDSFAGVAGQFHPQLRRDASVSQAGSKAVSQRVEGPARNHAVATTSRAFAQQMAWHARGHCIMILSVIRTSIFP